LIKLYVTLAIGLANKFPVLKPDCLWSWLLSPKNHLCNIALWYFWVLRWARILLIDTKNPKT